MIHDRNSMSYNKDYEMAEISNFPMPINKIWVYFQMWGKHIYKRRVVDQPSYQLEDIILFDMLFLKSVIYKCLSVHNYTFWWENPNEILLVGNFMKSDRHIHVEKYWGIYNFLKVHLCTQNTHTHTHKFVYIYYNFYKGIVIHWKQKFRIASIWKGYVPMGAQMCKIIHI